MNELIDNFDILMAAPGSIKMLRQMILQLAVQGRLVTQDKHDEPASILLEKIKQEKERLIKEGKLKPQQPMPLISEEEIPYTIPNGWQWTRLGDISNYGGIGKFYDNKIPNDSWVLDLEDIEKDTSKIIKRFKSEERQFKSTKAYFNKGDVLYGKLRPYLNKILVADSDGYCSTEIIPIKAFGGISPKYMMYSLKRPDFLNYVNKKTYGVKMPRLGTEDAKKSLFPLPSIAEQERIVEKVDRLMALCAELEKQQEERDKIEAGMNDASLEKLLDSSGDRDFQEHWQRIVDHFDIIYEKPGNVEKLKQAILQLAVRGKLERQDLNDEPASLLLEKIKQEKERLIKAGKLKPQQPIPPISEDEIPYPLPNGWHWVRLGEIGQIIGGGTPRTGNPEYFSDNGIPWITPSDMSLLKSKYISKGRRDISPQGLSESSARLMPAGSVLFSSRAPIGYVAIAENEISTNQGMKSCVPYIIDINLYLYCYLKYSAKEIDANASGTTFKEVSGKTFSLILCPLPPLAEQERIVEKVDRLMALCDRLAADLKIAQTLRKKLFQAILSKL